jgi:hypothetical protein
VQKPADFLHEKHVGLADCTETFLTEVFRQAYATKMRVSLVRALLRYLLTTTLIGSRHL